MDIKKLQSAVVNALEDVKAQDIRVFDTSHLTSLFDRIAIASGTSNRQTKALAASVRDKVKEKGGDVVGIEGEGTGEWVLVDLGDMIVHIMQPAIRAYYRLEEIWGDKEVKVGAAKRVSKRTASEPMEVEPAPKKVSRHLAASQAIDDAPPKPARKTPARSTTAGTTAAKTRAAKTPVGKTVKVASAKSATAVRKAPAKRAPAKKTTA
ncbi:MAG TPA: ribosome silencing factor [Burkholderiaceae bacterium]|nr:ribosome silencing factor [Burkholderiaceae bacterium]